MAKLAKFLQGVAGVGGAALNVEDVFSTYLYTGTGSATTITNGIDLAGEGGMVWGKSRTSSVFNHQIMDTERGTRKVLVSSTTDAEASNGDISAFNSDGFSLSTGNNLMLSNGQDFTSWTFRKAPKFFDVVTYTGNGVAGREIAHNLGTTVGFIVVKRTDTTGGWQVYHRSLGATKFLLLNDTFAATTNNTRWYDTEPTSTHFTVNNIADMNASGGTYVAYLFAHNDGDGEFGSTADQDVIKCGSFTEINGSDVTVDLGFEPQWIMIKVTSTTGGWGMYDVMRGWNSGGTDYALTANTSDAEASVGDRWLINPNGFTWKDTNNARDIAYIAIRRGPMAVPESATDVFAIDTRGSSSGEPGFKSGFVIDTFIDKIADSGTSGFAMSSRLTQGKFLQTNSTSAEGTQSSYQFDYMNGFGTSTGTNADYYAWMWRRAPNFCDVVAYTGTGSVRTVSHNLGVAPEMMWVKNRIDAVDWWVYHKDTGATKRLYLNQTYAALANSTAWNNTAPTDSVFTVGTSSQTNGSGDGMIAYLFASLDGISKVGSYTGNGTNTGDAQNIDCGFSSGARFVLIKATSVAYGWMLFDTERGITSGNDSLLVLNDIDAETTAFDSVDPYSSGFTAVQGPYNVNQSGVEYIFYAIA